jgi:hypothetical protein
MNIITKEISFCDRKTENIVSNENKEFILNLIKNYSIELDYKSAIILNQKLIKNITYHPHLLSIKSSGTNYFLFMTNINDINYCFYIDRKIKNGYNFPRIIATKYRFDDNIFEDTLLDGEIIRDNSGNWQFLISDLLIYKGKKVNCNITSRYELLYSMLEKHYTQDQKLEICPIFIKRIFMYKDWDNLTTEFIPNLNYNVRGLYFNTLNNKCTNYLYLFPRDHTFNKIVKKSSSIVTLLLKKTNTSDIYDVYCHKQKQESLLGIAHISSILMSKKIRKLFIDKNSVKMECSYSDKFSKWEPLNTSELEISDLSEIN